MSLSPEQIELRQRGISASEVGAIVGVDPWRRPIDIWTEKTGRSVPFAGNERTKWGVLLEPIIRSDYEERHGVRVEVHGTHVHPELDWWLATPDGLVYRGADSHPERGLEIKVHGLDALRVLEYGAPGTDEVPPHELVQCAWGMGATGLPRWDLCAFLAGSPAEYTIDRDDDLIGELRERAEKFLVDHVRKDVPPDPDGSKSYDAYLKKRFKYAASDLKLIDDQTTLAMIDGLRAMRAIMANGERLLAQREQGIKAIIGDGDGLTWDDPASKTGRSKITWRQACASQETDWEAVAMERRQRAALVVSAHRDTIDRMRNREAIDYGDLQTLRDAAVALAELAGDDIEKAHTTEVPGSRRFLVPRHWKSGDSPAEG